MPGLVYICGILMKIEEFSMFQACNMVLIAFGVLICAFGEVNLHPLGLTLQLSALSFEAARLTLVQILIKSKGISMNPIQSLYYISPACFVCLFIPWVQIESRQVIPLLLQGKVSFSPALLLLNALCAFALNLAVFLLIGKTSALTMNIAGVIKDWLLIWFSFSVFQVCLPPKKQAHRLDWFVCLFAMKLTSSLSFSLSLSPGACNHVESCRVHLLLLWSLCL